jgi:hypothetical protein
MNIASPNLLFRRFAGPVIAAYLLHLGMWLLLLTGTQVVLALLTRTVNWLAMALFRQFSAVEQEEVFLRPLAGELAYGIVPIILGLLVGWWVWHRRRRIL